MVRMQSVVSGHTFNKIRERLADKLEVIRFDPLSKYSEATTFDLTEIVFLPLMLTSC